MTSRERFRTGGFVGLGGFLLAAAVGCGSASGDEAAPCTFDAECMSGTCGADGTCAAPKDDPFVDGASGNEGDAACVDVDLNLTHIKPTVVLLVDQSGSMTDAFSGSQSRWAALRTTLMDPQNGIVKKLEGSVSFGLAMYTWQQSAGIATCPQITSVTAAADNYSAIDAVYSAATPVEATPTGNAIRKVAGIDDTGKVSPGGLAADPTPGPKIIILATDGNPDSCESMGGNDDASQVRAVEATKAAYAAGVKTFVIAVGDQLSEVNQQQIANAGVGQPADTGKATYYRTTSQSQLAQALESLALSVRSCKFTLHGTIASGSETAGTVTLDGQTLTYQGTDGWRLNGPNELELLGAACETVKSSPSADVRVVFPCGTATAVR